MALDVVRREAEIPCPGCGAHGQVPDGAARSGSRSIPCVLCKGKQFVTIDRCLEAGWPADVLAEVTVTHKHNIAAAMLVAPED